MDSSLFQKLSHYKNSKYQDSSSDEEIDIIWEDYKFQIRLMCLCIHRYTHTYRYACTLTEWLK